jgi:hydroxymethylglutaryl-CoA lyase
MTSAVRITDVSPRDGLQNEPGVIATADKARLVALLMQAGVDEIELTSFVSAKWVPQLGDAPELMQLVRDIVRALPAAAGGPGRRPVFSVLVPNDKGLDGALACLHAGCPIDKVSVFTAASEAFNKRNTNATIAESLERFKPVLTRAHAQGLTVRAYISCVIACPFAGPIAPAEVARVARQLADLGADEIDLGDTIGAGDARTTRDMLQAVLDELGPGWLHPHRLTLHLHDTFGRAGACVTEALRMGVRSFDASVAGLGGCPYASTPGKRAPGNISTELLVATIRQAGLRAGMAEHAALSDAQLQAASAFARHIVDSSRPSANSPQVHA